MTLSTTAKPRRELRVISRPYYTHPIILTMGGPDPPIQLFPTFVQSWMAGSEAGHGESNEIVRHDRTQALLTCGNAPFNRPVIAPRRAGSRARAKTQRKRAEIPHDLSE